MLESIGRGERQHQFSQAQVDDLMRSIYLRGDRLMIWFLVTHFALGLALAFYHSTWVATFLVGGASVGGMVLMAQLWPGSFATRCMASVFQQAFVALHIWQMHGQFEQHFWFFTALTMMIVYQDWRCMWLGTVLIIAQHTIFAVLHNMGYPVHFFPEAHVGFTKLFYHFGIAIVHVGICGYWAHLLRLQTLRDAWKQHELTQARERLEVELAHVQASERALAVTSEALGTSDRRQRAILDNMNDLAWVKDRHGRYLAANPAMAAAVGIEVDRIEGRTDSDIFPLGMADAFASEDRWIIQHRKPLHVERDVVGRDGRSMIVESVMTPILSEAGEVVGITGVGRDITKRKEAEAERMRLDAKVQHAQKLESLGVLAGGIAHDFNNLLQGILGNVSLARMDVPSGAEADNALVDAENSARRAAELTSQMLAYAGKGRFVVEQLDLSRTVREMSHLLAAVVTKRAERIEKLADGLPPIEADVAQLRQVIMNLITNASDALGDNRGTITLTTGAIDADRSILDAMSPDRELAEGRYVYLQVTDTGTGMDAATLQRIFDPFFTTKFTGRGLGLAAVQGILRSHRGAISVKSDVGRGTTFTVLFPTATWPAADATADDRAELGGGGRTILVVDDEHAVRVSARRTLERAGYTVDVAHDGEDALALVALQPERYDLVVLDLTMPRLGGVETQRELERLYPGLPVLLSSGFGEWDAVLRFAGRGLAGFLQKPYEQEELLVAVRKCARARSITSTRNA